jgi:hypothetical protein
MGVPLSASGEDIVVVRFMFGWLSCEAGFITITSTLRLTLYHDSVEE